MHFPFSSEPFKTQMGLKPLNLKDWIEIDDQRSTQLALKARILREQESTVLGVLDEERAREAALEFHELLWSHLQTQHAGVDFPRGPAPRSAKEALRETANWVQEDFCLLSADDQTLMAGIVCFPSRWKLPDKIGKNSDGIHRPVKHFDGIAKPTAVSLKQFPLPLVRFNWTIHDSDELFCPEAHHHEPTFPPNEILRHTFLRVERQTLRRLPKTQAIVFSIRTFITRLDRVTEDAERKSLLTSTLASLPREVADYKGMRYFFEDLLNALQN